MTWGDSCDAEVMSVKGGRGGLTLGSTLDIATNCNYTESLLLSVDQLPSLDPLEDEQHSRQRPQLLLTAELFPTVGQRGLPHTYCCHFHNIALVMVGLQLAVCYRGGQAFCRLRHVGIFEATPKPDIASKSECPLVD